MTNAYIEDIMRQTEYTAHQLLGFYRAKTQLLNLRKPLRFCDQPMGNPERPETWAVVDDRTLPVHDPIPPFLAADFDFDAIRRRVPVLSDRINTTGLFLRKQAA